MAQQVKLDIKIGGEVISPIADLAITQSLYNHNTLQVVLPLDAFKDDNSQILNQAKSFLNQPIIAGISSGIFGLLSRDFSFEGIVTDVRMERYQRGGKMIFITAYGPTIHLSGISNIRSFHEMSLADIVNEVLQDIPGDIKTIVDPNYTETIEYLVQYRETNMQFLQRLANTYGEWFYYDGNDLVFGKLPSSDAIDVPLEKDLLEMRLAMQVVPINYKSKTYDYVKHEVYDSTSKPTDVNDLDAFGKEILDKYEPEIYKVNSLQVPRQYFATTKSLDDQVLGNMAGQSRNMVVLSGTTDHIKLRVGSVINVTGEKSNEVDLEKFTITSIHHNIDENFSYTNTFEAIPAVATSPPENRQIHSPVCEIQQATVIENDDSESLGRIKVKFKWQKDGQTTPWIRIIEPYAGQSSDLHGFFFTPEIDDEVFVGFIHENPDRPFVMGSVYRHDDSNHPKEWHDPETKRKVIRTRSGNQIHFVDDNGKEEIIITNKDLSSATNEIRLSMEGDGKIVIKTLGALDIQAQSIKINSDTDININAGGDTNLDVSSNLNIKSGSKTDMQSQNMKIDAGPGFELKAIDSKIDATTASVKGSAQLDLEAMKTTVKGTAQVQVEGAQATVKGDAMLNLQSTGITSVSGTMVKLN